MLTLWSGKRKEQSERNRKMTPLKLLKAFMEKCHYTGMLEYDKERNEYGLLQLREDAPEKQNRPSTRKRTTTNISVRIKSASHFALAGYTRLT